MTSPNKAASKKSKRKDTERPAYLRDFPFELTKVCMAIEDFKLGNTVSPKTGLSLTEAHSMSVLMFTDPFATKMQRAICDQLCRTLQPWLIAPRNFDEPTSIARISNYLNAQSAYINEQIHPTQVMVPWLQEIRDQSSKRRLDELIVQFGHDAIQPNVRIDFLE